MSYEDSRWSPFILPPVSAKFRMGDHVENISGAGWRGRVVGFYFTDLTPIGYAVESDAHSGKMQIYPEKALRLVEPVMSKLSKEFERHKIDPYLSLGKFCHEHADAIFAALRAYETGASAAERMRERAAVLLDLDADDQSTSADEWHQKMTRKLRRLAAAIRALPTDGE